MALLFMDSFDHYATADITEKWTSTSTGLTDGSAIQATAGRRGGGCWRLAAAGSTTSSSKALFKVLAPADNTIIFGLAVNPLKPFTDFDTSGTDPEQTGSTAVTTIATIRNASANQCWIRLDAAGTLSVYRGTTLLGTTSAPIANAAYTYVEVRITIDNVAGAVGIRFNGVSVLTLAGVNTRAGAANAWNELRIGHVGSNSSTGASIDIDDLYVLDGSGPAPWNTFLGDCRVDARLPTAAGATTQWTPSAGANWQCVDDAAPNDDTDYNASATINQIDTFTVQDAPSGVVVYGVQAVMSAKKTDAGTCSLAPVIRHSGTDYVGTAQNPGTTYAYLMQVYQTNPGTSAQWIEPDFNAAEFGYKRTA